LRISSEFGAFEAAAEISGTTVSQKLLSCRVVHNWRESGMDRVTKHEIIIVAIASLAPIPLITAAVVTILS